MAISEDISKDRLQVVRELVVRPIRIANKMWAYIASGQRNQSEVVLFIRGFGTASDAWWQQFAEFDREFYTLSIDYPSITNPKEYADGIVTMLDRLKISKVYIVGNSYGACLAQWFAFFYKDRVHGLILNNAYLPNSEVLKNYIGFIRLIKYLPASLAVYLFKRKNQAILESLRKGSLVEDFLNETGRKNLRKRDLMSVFKSLVDTSDFNTGYLHSLPVLIIESNDDTVLDETIRLKLKQSYPKASVVTFPHGGHFSYITEASKFNNEVIRFLRGVQQQAKNT